MRKSFRVLGLKVPVRFVREIKSIPTAEDEQVLGLFDPFKKEILILQNLTQQQIVETCLHELGHAVLHRVGLDQVIPRNLQEIIVETYAQVIAENFGGRG